MKDAGHFQFLDEQSALDRAVCAVGRTPDTVVRLASQAIMVAWGQLVIRQRGRVGIGAHTNKVQVTGPLQELERQLAELCADVQSADAGALTSAPFQLRSKGVVDVASNDRLH